MPTLSTIDPDARHALDGDILDPVERHKASTDGIMTVPAEDARIITSRS